MNVNNSLVSQTLPESVDNAVPSGISGLFYVTNFLPAKHGFKMACLNINSLVKHVDELRVLLAEFSIHILAINETKLNESGYKFIRRGGNRNGGGVGFYIKYSLSYAVSYAVY